jgi:hypothetical protein
VFLVTDKKADEYGNVQVRMIPPYNVDTKPGDGAATHEDRYKRVNEGWSKFTPAGEVKLTITNPPAADVFVEGEYYLATFEPYKPNG